MNDIAKWDQEFANFGNLQLMSDGSLAGMNSGQTGMNTGMANPNGSFDWNKGFGTFGKAMGGLTSLAGIINARDQMNLMRRQSATQEKSLAANLFNQGTTVQNQLDKQSMMAAQMMYGADGGNREAMSLAASNAPQVRKTL